MLHHRFWMFGLALALLLPCGVIAAAEAIHALPGGQPVSRATALDALAAARVVYLGETHDQAADHRLQREILQALAGRDAPLVIGMEMFQRPFQPVLDRYLKGEIEEAQLVEQTEYRQRWRYDWELYAPILRFARERQIPVLALNAPTELTRRVYRTGLASLEPKDFEHLPPPSEIRTDNFAYRAYLEKSFRSAHGGGDGQQLQRFVEAQSVWDETMAHHLANFLRANPRHRAVVLVGQGHLHYGYGLPDRLARRLNVVQRTVLLGEREQELTVKDPGGQVLADYQWSPGPERP